MYRVADQRAAGGGTAVAVAVLALLGGIAGAVGVVSGLVAMVRSESGLFGWGMVPGWVSVVSGATLVIDLGSAVLLLVGAMLVFRRRGAGPMLVVLGCVGVLGAFVVTAISTVVQLMQYGIPIGRHVDAMLGQSVFNGLFSMERDVPWLLAVLLLVFPVVTFVLGVLPSTRRWCKGATAQRRPGGAWAPSVAGGHPGMPPMVGAPHQPGPGGALHAHSGAQFVGGAPHPGTRPLLDAPHPGGQHGPGAPYQGAQPAPGTPYMGTTPTPGTTQIGAQTAPDAPRPDAPTPYPSAPLRPDAQRPAPNQVVPPGYQRTTAPPRDHRPQDGYRA